MSTKAASYTIPEPVVIVRDIEPTVRGAAAKFEREFPGVPYTVSVELNEALKLVVVVNPIDSWATYIQ